MKRRVGDLRERRVAVLGLAFKRDTDDERDSLAHKLIRLLERELADVVVHDPMVATPTTGLDEAVAGADVVVVATNHSAYSSPQTLARIGERAAPDCLRGRPVERVRDRPGLRLRHRARRAARVKRVLVTGGAGTIGAAVVRRLLRDPDFEVRVSDQRAAPAWMREGCEVHRGDLRVLARGAQGARRLHARHPPRRDRRRDRELPQAPAHAHRGQQRALQRGRPRGARRGRRALRLRQLEHGLRARGASSRRPRTTSTTARSPLLGLRLLEAHRRDLLPRRARRARPAVHDLPARSTPTARARCPTTSPASPTRCPTCIRKSLAGLRPLPIFGSGEQTRTLHARRRHRRRHRRPRWPQPAGLNEDFNISAREELTVAEIARICWEACGNDPDELELEHLPSFEVDVARRWPSVEKASGCWAGRRRSTSARASRRPTAWLREHGGWRRERKRALITGITGQDGSYLAELLLEKGYEVHGMVRRASTEKFERIEHLRDRITLHQGDLLDQRSLVDTLRASQPDEIYNLAAMSFVARLLDPADADRGVHRRRRHAHARGDARGLPRRRASTRRPRARCSARCARRRRTRTTPFYPRSPYGVAKVYGHHITVNYRESYDLFAHVAGSSSTTRARAAAWSS